MQLTILGSGTSTGVPLIFCKCKVCKSKNPKNKRLRASAWLEANGKSFLIDTSVDLRQQALRARIPRIDAVLYTHPHADHIFGLDELRSFNYIQKARIPVYGNKWTQRRLFQTFDYVFSPEGPIRGGGIPLLDFHLLAPDQDPTPMIEGTPFTLIDLPHGDENTLGFRIGDMAYITDCVMVPVEAQKKLQDLGTLVLDCARLARHDTHLNLEQALEVAAQVKAKRTYLTHMGHDFDYVEWSRKLPRGVALAYDGLKLKGSLGRRKSS